MFGNPKKSYFRRKAKDVERTIWDFSFKRFKTLEIREEVRQLHDDAQHKISLLKTQIEAEEKDEKADKAETAKKKDQLVLLERDRDRFIEQMKALDLEVFGSKPTNEYPQGVQGVDQQIEALHELKDMIRDYIKTL